MAVKGLKKTSETISIGFSVEESAANTFTQGRIDLNLDPLNNEVFVVSAINLDPFPSSAISGTDTRVRAALTTTSKAGMPGLSDSNCLATSTNQIQAAGFADGGVGFQQHQSIHLLLRSITWALSPPRFLVQVEGDNNPVAKGVNGKLYGYRAKADASIYCSPGTI